jgi:precorrin-2 dehydrogenase/sirohydrochlorin ferrochelatase
VGASRERSAAAPADAIGDDSRTLFIPSAVTPAVIPLLHDFAGERVLVVGGGSVGARKARRFAREARVVVVSPAFADADFGGAERVRVAPDPDLARELVARADPALVVAATDDPAVNDAVAAAARERGALVNRADRRGDRDAGSVVVPATVRDGPVSVAVATDATSPAVSRHLRRAVEPLVDGAGAVAAATGALRDRLREREVAPERRRAAVRAAAGDDDVWAAAREGDDAVVRDTVERVADDVLTESD